ncbi:MAG: hypothetical protein J1E39_03770 [Eubacterium sp.]|nr:hypothetical protein [Eubacterium sp.]
MHRYNQSSDIDIWTEKLERENDADAALYLGYIYLSPKLAERNSAKADYNKACRYFEISAKLGNTIAMEKFAVWTALLCKERLKAAPEFADRIITALNNALRWADVREKKGFPMDDYFYNDVYITLGCAYSWLVMFGKDIKRNCEKSVAYFKKVNNFKNNYYAMFRYIYVASKL